jgi:hypothetical protein
MDYSYGFFHLMLCEKVKMEIPYDMKFYSVCPRGKEVESGAM